MIGMTPQALSYHLRKLKNADLIYETRYKNFIYYELNLTVLDEAIVWINQIIGKRKIENLLAVAVTFPAKSMRDTMVSGKNHTTKSDTTSGANINAR